MTAADVNELVAAARHDLQGVEAALNRGAAADPWQCLAALAVLARAAQAADAATFALLEGRAERLRTEREPPPGVST